MFFRTLAAICWAAGSVSAQSLNQQVVALEVLPGWRSAAEYDSTAPLVRRRPRPSAPVPSSTTSVKACCRHSSAPSRVAREAEVWRLEVGGLA